MYYLPKTLVLFIKSAGIFNKGKFCLASLLDAHVYNTWLLVFLIEPIVTSSQKLTRDNLYDPLIASNRMTSLVEINVMLLNSISNALVRVVGNAEKASRDHKSRSTLRLSEAQKLVCFIEMELCAAHDMCPAQPKNNFRFV